MDDLDITFCFPCFSCHAKFGSLRELRKHLCELSTDLTKSSTIFPIKTDVINRVPIPQKLFLPEYNESKSPRKDSLGVVLQKKPENSSDKSSQNKEALFKQNISLVCVPCKKVFPDQILYYKHEWAHNMNKNNTNKFLSCSEEDCFEILPNSKLLKSHKSKIHGIQKIFTCNICTFSSKYECDLKRHHDRKHLALDSCICTECGKYFRSQYALQYHMKKKYSVYDYKCQSCDFKAILDAQLKAHVMNIHTKAHPFICTECGQGFTAKCYLKNHMSIHTGEKKYNCTSCKLCFRQKTTLKKHELIHFNIRPFECNMCPKKFRVPTNLQVHIKRHLNQKDYVCGICKKGFIEPAGLRKHSCLIKS